MKHVSYFVALALSGAAVAQPVSQTPWMTGERLVRLLANVDPATIYWTESSPFRSRAIAAEYLDMSNGEFVRGYIQAVHDATEGKDWCWSAQHHPKPHEMEMDARGALQKMNDAQLKRNAVDLIVDVWRKKWPCPVERRRP